MPSNGTIYKVTIISVMYGVHFRNSFHFRARDPGVNAQALLLHFQTNFTIRTAYKKMLNQKCVWVGTEVEKIHPVKDDAVQGSENLPGDIINVDLPTAMCWLFSLYSTRNDRHGRGRLYIPAPTHLQMYQAGYTSDNARYQANESFEWFLDTWSPIRNVNTPWSWVIWSRELQEDNTVLRWALSAKLAVMSRRKPGVGY